MEIRTATIVVVLVRSRSVECRVFKALSGVMVPPNSSATSPPQNKHIFHVQISEVSQKQGNPRGKHDIAISKCECESGVIGAQLLQQAAVHWRLNFGRLYDISAKLLLIIVITCITYQVLRYVSAMIEQDVILNTTQVPATSYWYNACSERHYAR